MPLPDDIDTLWDYRQPSASEEKFRALLPEVEVEGCCALRIEILTQIARAQGLQRRFADAHRTLDQAGALLAAGMARPRTRWLLERGRVFNSSGRPAASRTFFIEAWDLARAAGEDFYAVDAAHMLGIVEPPGEQIAWTERAIDLAGSSRQPKARSWLGSLTNNLGWAYHDLKQYESALARFRQALSFREEQGRQPEIRIARWCIGRALRSLNRLEEALAIQRELLREWEEAGKQDGYVYEEVAECLLALERPDEARPYFGLARRELSQDPWLAENEPARLARLEKLGAG